ncbi:unnamed protein product, partial [Polarella glacialis]
MVLPGVAEAAATPLERTLQSWVAGWGSAQAADGGAGGGVALLQNLQEGFHGLQSLQGFHQGLLQGRSVQEPVSDEETTWEEALARQNSANDELCSINGRLQAELDRLKAEDEEEVHQQELADQQEKMQANEEAPDTEEAEPPPALEEELLACILREVQQALSAYACAPPAADA